MPRYQFVERFDPSDRTASVEYAPGKSIDFMGDPQELTEKQFDLVSRLVVLRELADDEEAQAEFGPAPEEKDEGKKKSDNGGADVGSSSQSSAASSGASKGGRS